MLPLQSASVLNMWLLLCNGRGSAAEMFRLCVWSSLVGVGKKVDPLINCDSLFQTFFNAKIDQFSIFLVFSLKVHYATFYGLTDKQVDRAVNTRNSSLQEPMVEEVLRYFT